MSSNTPFLVAICVLLSSSLLFSQENRSIEGDGNNLTHPEFGAANTNLIRIVPNAFGDFISTPSGTDRPNPRVISNNIFDQDIPVSDGMTLSDFLWVFAQLIDHDITEISGDPSEQAMIPVDFPDPHFNPGGIYQNIMIPMSRNLGVQGTGTSLTNPREYANHLTAWLDASCVYGSTDERAAWLRSFQNGKLKVSTGNLLPWNTVTGEKEAAVDANAPNMANDVGLANRLFVAGDFRANEQPLLTAFHTVFVREHNRLCDKLVAEHPNWTDEELYQTARRWNAAFFQSVIFNEWLPAMGVTLPAYSGYNDDVNPGISNVFSGAAYRLGHTLLNSNILRHNDAGETIPEGNLTLAQAFFNPDVVENVGIDVYFKGMASQVEQALDCKMVSDVRNFLFGPPGAGGLDLAAININRGRERGIPAFNELRIALGKEPFASFSDITNNSILATALELTYLETDKIDCWVGLLAESPMPNALFGETIMEIMKDQFLRLRDADRFFYEIDPAFTSYDRMIINETKMSDIIMRNTNINLMQENVFLAMDHGDICNATSPNLNVQGTVYTGNSESVTDVEIEILDHYGNPVTSQSTTSQGTFLFEDMDACNYYAVTAEKNTDDYRNGVATLDIVLFARQLIGLDAPASHASMAAGDVNGDLSVNSSDLLEMQKLLLWVNSEFPNAVPSWRLVPQEVVETVTQPFPFLASSSYDLGLLQDPADVQWLAYKMGDFDGSADVDALLTNAEDRTSPMIIEIADLSMKAGETYEIDLSDLVARYYLGTQFAMNFDHELLNVDIKDAPKGFAFNRLEDGIVYSWFSTLSEQGQKLIFEITAKQDGLLSDLLTFEKNSFQNNIVSEDLNQTDLTISILPGVPNDLFGLTIAPNPAINNTTVSWNQELAMGTDVSVYDINGKMVYSQNILGHTGRNYFELNTEAFSVEGVYTLKMRNQEGESAQRIMVLNN